MTKENKIPMSIEQDSEVDFIFLAQKLWQGRYVVIKIMSVSLIIGILAAFLSPKEYRASSTMVPQITDQKSKLSPLSGLAAIAGVSLSTIGGSELAPSTYPQIISSVPFQLELMKVPLNFAGLEGTVTLFDYYTKIKQTNPFIKYSFGLPSIIRKAIKGNSEKVYPATQDILYDLNDKQIEVQNIMAEIIGVNINDKDGYITIYCSLPEAYAAAQLTKSTQLLLQRYITEFKIKKAQANHDFILQRFNEAKQKYEQAQKELAIFRDQNKNVATALARTRQEQLTGEYSLIYGVYSELAKKLEQAKIDIKEETPVFTIIKPVSVPSEKSKPNRPFIIVIFTFIGLIIGLVVVLSRDYADQLRRKWLAINS